MHKVRTWLRAGRARREAAADMLDFLRAPAGQYDALDTARAVALRYIDARYDRFEDYYNNRVLLEQDVAAVLHDHGLTADTSL